MATVAGLIAYVYYDVKPCVLLYASFAKALLREKKGAEWSKGRVLTHYGFLFKGAIYISHRFILIFLPQGCKILLLGT